MQKNDIQSCYVISLETIKSWRKRNCFRRNRKANFDVFYTLVLTNNNIALQRVSVIYKYGNGNVQINWNKRIESKENQQTDPTIGKKVTKMYRAKKHRIKLIQINEVILKQFRWRKHMARATCIMYNICIFCVGTWYPLLLLLLLLLLVRFCWFVIVVVNKCIYIVVYNVAHNVVHFLRIRSVELPINDNRIR